MKFSKFILGTLTLLSSIAFAGADGSGGGDWSESIFYDIAYDIRSWILKGGSNSLKLPEGITQENYKSQMLEVLSPGVTVISFTTNNVQFDGKDKTCRSYYDDNTRPNILCNISRFLNADEESRYKLVHHEYATLARIEKASGAASDYFVSNQITTYLELQTILRLAIKEPTELISIKYLENKYKIFFDRELEVRYFGGNEARISKSGIAMCKGECGMIEKMRASSRSRQDLTKTMNEQCQPWGIKRRAKIKTDCWSTQLVGSGMYDYWYGAPEELQSAVRSATGYICLSDLDYECKD